MNKLLLGVKIFSVTILCLSITASLLSILYGRVVVGIVAIAFQVYLIWIIMGRPEFWKQRME
ncbi:hypothetical protein [Telluribacter humicola]|uniref:hypothetical protein n=1 Tax=Telluribacter humicola TaxID=1720261 RepID=UPI001A970563|nr:hypothetical protein [Telluribacter humicola]